MKCAILCVVVILVGVPRRDAAPQGLFGGLLPAAKPQGDDPPKGPLAIFSQGQQATQNVVGGFITGLAGARDKIRDETKKRIQNLLNATMGNKNKEETASEKPEEHVGPDKEQPPEKLQVPDKVEIEKPAVESHPEIDVKKPDVSLDKVKENDENLDKLLEEVFSATDGPESEAGPPKTNTSDANGDIKHTGNVD